MKTEDIIKLLEVDEDFKLFITTKTWYANGTRPPRFKVNGTFVTLSHHVLGRLPGFVIDHINRNVFNHKRKNLRVVTNRANVCNHGLRSIYTPNNSIRSPYLVRFSQVNLGRFKTYKEAAVVYDKTHLELFLKELSQTRHLNPHLTDEEYYYYYPCQISCPIS